MPQITQLDNDTTPNNNDLLVTVDMAAGTTKNISREQFLTGAPLPADTVDTQAIADGSITSPKLDYTTLNFGNYSTSEVNTGLTWANGDTIYKKTIDIGALPGSATSKNVAHGISNLKQVIELRGVVQNGITSSDNSFPLPYAGVGANASTNAILLARSGANIVVETGSNRSSYFGTVTIFYTKTT